MTYEEMVSQVAESVGLPKKMVDKIYKAFWKAVRIHIESLPMKQELTDDEFLQLKPNVNIPSIGKFHVTLDRYHRVKSRRRIIEEFKSKKHATHQENQTSVW